MTVRHTVRRLVVLAATAALVLTGCGGGGGRLDQPRQRGTQAINAKDPATLRQGGDLRLPLDRTLPVNYNYNHVDGHEGNTHYFLWALMPHAFDEAPDGGTTLNTDLLDSATLTSTAPQTVAYKINTNAVWTDGRPITWEDFAAQVTAMKGTNPSYRVVSTTGYRDIARVERGATDKDVVLTFARPYAEWKGLFIGLYPKETNSDPTVFNEGWIQRPLATAGPFRVQNLDQTAKTIVLVRNERWWGARPPLDRIIFSVTDRAALADRLANNEIDWYEIGSSVDLFQRARGIPGVEIRQATPKQYSHLTFNGAPGAILSDLKLRQAIAKGIDRVAVSQRLVGQIVPDVRPMGNHVYPIGSTGYRDNAGALRFDPEAANRELDALGWTRQGPVRRKDGRELSLRYISEAANPISEQISRTVLDQLAQIGVRLVIEAVPASAFFRDYAVRGNFDLVSFQWVTELNPFSDGAALYAEPKDENVEQNYGRIYNPEITRLFEQGLSEFDDAKRVEIGNQIDLLVWDEVHHIPLYPQSGACAVRSTLANWGAKGLGGWDYVKVGFTQ